MIFRKQLTHKDCFRTALGCMLDLEPQDVPDFVEEDGGEGAWSEEGKDRVRAWLQDRGYDMIDTAYTVADRPLQDLLGHIRHIQGRDIIYMCVGKNPRGEPHVVICRGDSILWDTSPINCGIPDGFEDGVYWVYYIAKSFMRYTP